MGGLQGWSMSYQVLARKWRPRRFEQMVGQTHVLRALINALDSKRLHHAYLFTGTRGVGKTTVARIFAKALNCKRGISSDPCGECAACMEIDEGRFVDLIEVDAASRTKVDETRELLENVQYAPTYGRFKVYLIDEVHMFSGHSFNALLKTLEEPPPHVKFLLATTDPKKLPVTILSRCLQFNLKRLNAELIEAQLEAILRKEQIPTDARSCRLLAEAADGSLRDALSLLDQAIAYGGGELKEAEISAMLGTVDRDWAVALLERLAAQDACGVLEQIERMAEFSPDYMAVLAEMLSELHRIAVYQMIAEGKPEELSEYEDIKTLAARITPEECQLFYQIALIGRRDLPLVPDPRRGLEMILLRMLAFYRETLPVADTLGEKTSLPPVIPLSDEGKNTPPTIQAQEAPQVWRKMIEPLPLSGLARELALNCVLKSQDGNRCRLLLPPSAQHLWSEKLESRLEQILRIHYGNDLQITITVADLDGQVTPLEEAQLREQQERQAAAQAIGQDPNVKALCEAFSAQVTAIRPGGP
jgi:DNA polymerase-3 subunit gamma/tau